MHNTCVLSEQLDHTMYLWNSEALCTGGIVVLEQCLHLLVPVKKNLNSTVYRDIVDNRVLSTLWQQFEEVTLMLVCW